jgi:hypothetical protein
MLMVVLHTGRKVKRIGRAGVCPEEPRHPMPTELMASNGIVTIWASGVERVGRFVFV